MKKAKAKKIPKKEEKPVSKHAVVKSKNVGIVPLGSRILIKPFTKEELATKNSFGIILPNEDSTEKSEQGIVLAVGPGEYQDGDLIKTTVKVGERVVFSKYGYEDISFNGEDFYLIKEENILAVLK